MRFHYERRVASKAGWGQTCLEVFSPRRSLLDRGWVQLLLGLFIVAALTMQLRG